MRDGGRGGKRWALGTEVAEERDRDREMLLEKGEEVREVGEVSSFKGKGYCLTRT